MTTERKISRDRNVLVQCAGPDRLRSHDEGGDSDLGGLPEVGDDMCLEYHRTVIRRLGRTLRRRIVKELNSLAEKDAGKYQLFWDSYSRQLKEGLASDSGAKDEILPLLRFHSSTTEMELTSLEDYVGRMSPDQEEIYYVLGESVQTAALRKAHGKNPR